MATSAGSVDVRIGADDRDSRRAFARLDSSMTGVQGTARRAFGAVGKAAAIGMGAVATGIGFALDAAGDFEQSMNMLKAVSGASGRQMKAMGRLAKDLGADLTLPATSAKDAAEAMLELSKGGLTVTETMAAAKGVLQLSAAATISNAEAAQITARALNAFNLEGSEATRVADVLANAANKSTGEISDFALGLQQSSAVAAQWGLSINETTAALMQLADAGVVGSDAGTSLKTMLQSLSPSSVKAAGAMRKLGVDVFDSSGKFVGIEKTIGMYRRGLEKLTPEQQKAALKIIFGSDAIRAANIILGKGVDKYREYVKKTEESGTAAKVAAAKMSGFKGALSGLQSQVETLAVNLGEKLIPKATFVVSRINELLADIGAAKGFKAKLNVVWDFGTGIADALKKAIFGAWESTAGSPEMLKGSAKFTPGLQQMIQKAVRDVDWQSVGREIMEGFKKGVQASIGALDAVISSVAAAIIRNRRKIAEAGAVLALTLVETIFDPGFWAKHWDIGLAAIAAVFGRGLGKLAGRLVAPLAKLGGDMVLGIVAGIERFAPRLASAMLAGVLKLPGLLRGALGALTGVVTSVFGRLGKIAVFTVKVLGIMTVIQAFVGLGKAIWAEIQEMLGWLRRLPGQIQGAFAGAGGWLYGAGAAIIGGLWEGIKSKFGVIKDGLTGLKDKIIGWKGPPSADAKLLVGVGKLIIGGLNEGMRSQVAETKRVLTGLGAAVREQLGAVAKIQAQIDRINNARAAADRRQAVIDAIAAVAEARKKGEGVAAAERTLNAAREAIRIAHKEKMLGIAQAEADGLATKLEKAKAAMDRAKEREAAALEARKESMRKKLEETQRVIETAQEKAGAAFDKLASRIRIGFDAATAAFQTPAEIELQGIRDRRATEDLNRAVTEAEANLNRVKAAAEAAKDTAKLEREIADAKTDLATAERKLAEAQEQGTDDLSSYEKAVREAEQKIADLEATLQEARSNTDWAAKIEEAERTLARAREDIVVAGLENTARGERKAFEDQRAEMGRQLDERLSTLRTKLAEEGTTWDSAMSLILGTLASYGVDFATVGALLGTEFATALKATATGAASASQAVATAQGAMPKPFVYTSPRSFLQLQHGGIVKHRPGGILANIGEGRHDEAVVPLPHSGGLGGGGNTYVLQLPNLRLIRSDRELEDILAAAIMAAGRRSGRRVFNGYATS